MKSIGLVVLGFLGSLVVVAIGDMVSEEVRARLDRLPHAVLCLAIRRLPGELRADIGKDWHAELDHILHRAKLYPVTRLIKGVHFGAGLLRTAPRIARSLALIRGSVQTQTVDAPQLARVPAVVKRIADVAVSALLLVLLAPTLAVVAFVIKLADGGPVLIREGVFALKFRTTVITSGNLDGALSLSETDRPRLWGLYDRRVTRVGRFLRRLSLDELPGLWSVLRGKASLFGPRR